MEIASAQNFGDLKIDSAQFSQAPTSLKFMRRYRYLLLAFLIFGGNSAVAGDIRVATWNVKEGTIENLLHRRTDLVEAGKKIRADVLIVQEINSFSSAQFLAQEMGMTEVEIAVSNFNRDDKGAVFTALETAVISKIPIVSVSEWQNARIKNGNVIPDPYGPILISPEGDVTTKNTDSSDILEVPSDIITKESDRDFGVARGILRVELEGDIVIYPVHLKSNISRLCGLLSFDLPDVFANLGKLGQLVPSVQKQIDEAIYVIRNITRGGKDNPTSIGNKKTQESLDSFVNSYVVTAKNRENAAAFVAKMAVRDIESGKSVIVAGDFNTPLIEPSKTGTDLSKDCVPQPWSCSTDQVTDSCKGKDGFDDTLHILSGGIVNGLKLKPVFTKAEATHTKPGFAPSPIDNIYISDNMTASKTKKVTGNSNSAFGSDHFPVITTIKIP